MTNVKATVKRLPVYLEYLRRLPPHMPQNISATAIAQALCLGEVQVRKDLASISTSGRPRIGYQKDTLIHDIEHALGLSKTWNAVVVGAGHLGMALYNHQGFCDYGLRIRAAVDIDSKKCDGKNVFPLSDLPVICRTSIIRIGILTVPDGQGQTACDAMVQAGIAAIWNFTSVCLHVPEGVLVQNENMASSLSVLSCHLQEHLHNQSTETEAFIHKNGK